MCASIYPLIDRLFVVSILLREVRVLITLNTQTIHNLRRTRRVGAAFGAFDIRYRVLIALHLLLNLHDGQQNGCYNLHGPRHRRYHRHVCVGKLDPRDQTITGISSLFALASPELEILAFITSFGNTDVASSRQNILKAYQAVSRHLERFPEDAPRFPNFSPAVKPILACGSAGPLEGELHSAQYFHGRDGLGGIAERHPELDVDENDLEHPQLDIRSTTGLDVALELIRSRPPRTITYLALGPLTDLGWLMSENAALVREKIGRIVCMGGALDVPGNTSPVAEFNFFADPYAVKKLLIQDADIDSSQILLPLDRFILLPLDITTPHELPFPFYKENIDPSFETSAMPSDSSNKSPLTHFTSSFLEQTRVVMLQFGKDAMELHDIVAVWCAIENPPVPDGAADTLGLGWKARNRTFDIERTGELTRGMLVCDRRDDLSAYTVGANRANVQAELDKHTSHHGTWESTALPALVETEHPPKVHDSRGVMCVHTTPGPDTLLALLVKRVWGVSC
ncbi:Inosine/uridine-preferring nucleoside hydrolase domain-containing protein [Mycena rosella]|uniref:Inosine/uridine-preferring nucleoside hydrolase domain-containing protein n=1 Tax=Mycena rosella TaxID=1033263 RepID=A0AAD7DHU9_MYCRO|nr:Inosine/uridine-preferring nucleoside hydrolase domain-containing protein [Mycena rosella]